MISKTCQCKISQIIIDVLKFLVISLMIKLTLVKSNIITHQAPKKL